MVKIALSLTRGRHLAIDPVSSPQTEKGRRKRKCSCARHYGAPSEPPRLLHASLHQSWLRPHFRLCPQLDECAGFLRPSSAHLQGQDHQTSAPGTTVRGMSVSSSSVRLQEPPCPCWRHTFEELHRPSVPSPMSCQLPVELHQTVGVHRPQPPITGCPPHSALPSPCSSRTCWSPHVLRLLCKSWLQRSRGENPLLPSNPVREHAARWWPKVSFGRPHPQMRWDKGRGRERRRWRSTRNNGDSMRGKNCTLTKQLQHWALLATEPWSSQLPPFLGTTWLPGISFPHRPCCQPALGAPGS